MLKDGWVVNYPEIRFIGRAWARDVYVFVDVKRLAPSPDGDNGDVEQFLDVPLGTQGWHHKRFENTSVPMIMLKHFTPLEWDNCDAPPDSNDFRAKWINEALSTVAEESHGAATSSEG